MISSVFGCSIYYYNSTANVHIICNYKLNYLANLYGMVCATVSLCKLFVALDYIINGFNLKNIGEETLHS
jgi:hypothetical protein